MKHILGYLSPAFKTTYFIFLSQTVYNNVD